MIPSLPAIDTEGFYDRVKGQLEGLRKDGVPVPLLATYQITDPTAHEPIAIATRPAIGIHESTDPDRGARPNDHVPTLLREPGTFECIVSAIPSTRFRRGHNHVQHYDPVRWIELRQFDTTRPDLLQLAVYAILATDSLMQQAPLAIGAAGDRSGRSGGLDYASARLYVAYTGDGTVARS